jgi:hypothetical protein
VAGRRFGGGQGRRDRLPAAARGRGKKLKALLDAQAGIQYEGETHDEPDADSLLAVRCWNFLATGMGGFDYGGLDTVAALFDLPDDQLELLLYRLDLIKRHRPPTGPSKD